MLSENAIALPFAPPPRPFRDLKSVLFGETANAKKLKNNRQQAVPRFSKQINLSLVASILPMRAKNDAEIKIEIEVFSTTVKKHGRLLLENRFSF